MLLAGDGFSAPAVRRHTSVIERILPETNSGWEANSQAVEAAVVELKKLSKPVKGEMISQVGSVSANNDKTTGVIIAEAMKKVGKDGVITVEEAKSIETSLEVVEGMQFDRGYLSPYFVTDAERMEVELNDCLILLQEKKISSMKDLLPVLEQVARFLRGLE